MEQKFLFEGERRLLNIIWDHEPLTSGELVRLCFQELGWKKSTTYTMLKRLAEKGFLVSFIGNRKLSVQEAEELKRLIDAHRENS